MGFLHCFLTLIILLNVSRCLSTHNRGFQVVRLNINNSIHQLFLYNWFGLVSLL